MMIYTNYYASPLHNVRLLCMCGAICNREGCWLSSEKAKTLKPSGLFKPVMAGSEQKMQAETCHTSLPVLSISFKTNICLWAVFILWPFAIVDIDLECSVMDILLFSVPHMLTWRNYNAFKRFHSKSKYLTYFKLSKVRTFWPTLE